MTQVEWYREMEDGLRTLLLTWAPCHNSMWDVGLVTPQDLGPLCSGPVLVPLGPVQPSLLLSLREKGLPGCHMAGDLQLLGDDVPDGAPGDVTELGDLLLEATWGQEGISHQLPLFFWMSSLT